MMFHFYSLITMLFNTLSSELLQFVTALTQLAFVLALMFFFASRFLKNSAPFVAEREQIRPLVGTTCAPIVLMRAEVEKMKAHTRLLEADLTKIEKMHEDIQRATDQEATYHKALAKSFENVHLSHMESNENFYMDLVDVLRFRLSQTQYQITAAERADKERGIRTMLHKLYKSQNHLIVQEQVHVDKRMLCNSIIIAKSEEHNKKRVLAVSRIALKAHEVRLTAQLAEQPVQH
jgi:hypothetical protein